MPGIGRTVDIPKEHGLRGILGTVTWRFAAETLRGGHGFDAVSGTEMEVVGKSSPVACSGTSTSTTS